MWLIFNHLGAAHFTRDGHSRVLAGTPGHGQAPPRSFVPSCWSTPPPHWAGAVALIARPMDQDPWHAAAYCSRSDSISMAGSRSDRRASTWGNAWSSAARLLPITSPYSVNNPRRPLFCIVRNSTDHFSCLLIHVMHLKHRLCNINPNGRKLRDGSSGLPVNTSRISPLGTLMPSAREDPPPSRAPRTPDASLPARYWVGGGHFILLLV